MLSRVRLPANWNRPRLIVIQWNSLPFWLQTLHPSLCSILGKIGLHNRKVLPQRIFLKSCLALHSVPCDALDSGSLVPIRHSAKGLRYPPKQLGWSMPPLLAVVEPRP